MDRGRLVDRIGLRYMGIRESERSVTLKLAQADEIGGEIEVEVDVPGRTKRPILVDSRSCLGYRETLGVV
jgi:hypothetical protein